MSYVTPIVPTFSGVKNIERIIAALQTIVADNIPWLTFSFGLAERFVSEGDRGAYAYPATFITNQDHYDCLPNDNVAAFSFWKISDPSSLDNMDQYAFERWPHVTTEVHFTVFANLSKIDNVISQYVTRSKMRQDVINCLSNKISGDFKLIPLRIYENDMTQIYSEYSIEQIDNLKKQLPFWAIKVECDLVYIADCNETDNSYSLINPEVESGWFDNWIDLDSVLFFGRTENITDGKLYNEVTGATDFLTVGGVAGAETYTCPNTAEYIAADTDKIWFTLANLPRTVTTSELIGYDLQSTPVRYDNSAPHTIRAIMIRDGIFTATQRNLMFHDFRLHPLWDNLWNDNGFLKDNRGFAQQLWTPV